MRPQIGQPKKELELSTLADLAKLNPIALGDFFSEGAFAIINAFTENEYGTESDN